MKKIRKNVKMIVILGFILTLTSCGKRIDLQKNKSANHIESSTQADNKSKLDNKNKVENTSVQEADDNSQGSTQNSNNLGEQSTSISDVKADESNNFSNWEEAYKDVLLSPEKYAIRLMDSTAPDEGWNNLGFSIRDLDGDQVPELLVYYNDGSNSSSNDILAFTNNKIQNVTSLWTQGAYKADNGSFITIDNGGLYSSSYSYRFKKNEQGTYVKVKSFEYINDSGAEIELYKEDGKDISKNQFLQECESNAMDDSKDFIESSGDYHVLDAGLTQDTSSQKMDDFWTK